MQEHRQGLDDFLDEIDADQSICRGKPQTNEATLAEIRHPATSARRARSATFPVTVTLQPTYNPDRLELIYDRIETRPGTTKEQMALGLSGLSAISGWAVKHGTTLLGSALWKNFKERAGSELIGLQAGSASDLALVAQILRDPRFETMRGSWPPPRRNRMPISDQFRKIYEAAKKLAAKRRARERNPQPPSQPSLQPKPSTLLVSEMLTPSEIAQLRQEQNAQADLLQKEFPNARIIRRA